MKSQVKKSGKEQKISAGFGGRLKEARKRLGLNQGQMAAKCGTRQNRLSQYENEIYRPSFEFLQAISGLGISADWILRGDAETGQIGEGAAPTYNDIRGKVAELARIVGLEGQGAPAGALDPEDFHRLPLLSDEAAAGQGREVRDNEIEDYCLIHRKALRNPDKTVCVRVKGDSMAPILPDGSIVAVNKARNEVEDLEGQVVAAYFEDGVTIKRLVPVEGAILLVAENRAYRPVALDFERGDRIIGACEWAWVNLA